MHQVTIRAPDKTQPKGTHTHHLLSRVIKRLGRIFNKVNAHWEARGEIPAKSTPEKLGKLLPIHGFLGSQKCDVSKSGAAQFEGECPAIDRSSATLWPMTAPPHQDRRSYSSPARRSVISSCAAPSISAQRICPVGRWITKASAMASAPAAEVAVKLT